VLTLKSKPIEYFP